MNTMMQRPLRVALILWVLCWVALQPVEAGPSVRSVGVTVADLDRSVAFFTEVLDFREVSRDEFWGPTHENLSGIFGARMRIARLRLGAEAFTLTEYQTPRGRTLPENSRSNDHWFQHIAIVVSDIDAAYARLRQHRVRHVSTGPQTLPAWNPNAGGIRAFYFQDPDGHNLEIIWYPPGKGQARWQGQDGRLFLGIDHTAIVVSDTERGLAFYRGLLGLEIAGTSENWGTEQEHLNLVFGARLRITALRGDSGPGIEFLEYLTPSDGRPAPADLAANDLLHWQVEVAGVDPARIREGLRQAGGRPVSSGVIQLPSEKGSRESGTLVRDADGHAVLVVGEN